MASGLLLYGMSMIYGATGTLDLAKIHVVVGDIGAFRTHRTLLAFGLVFLVAGIAFKFGAAPFHMWIPDVYQGAPTAMSCSSARHRFFNMVLQLDVSFCIIMRI